jgi:hypothetical protein
MHLTIVALKVCTVVVHDLNDTVHQLDVTAETLYEAVAQGHRHGARHDWVGLTRAEKRLISNPER